MLAPELRNAEGARNVAFNLLLKAAQRLRARELTTTSIILLIATQEQGYLKHRIKLPASSDSTSLATAMLKGWEELIKAALKPGQDSSTSKTIQVNATKLTIRKVIVNLSNLQGDSAQLSFNYLTEDTGVKRKRESLSRSIDKINTKYGHNTIFLGHLPKKHNKAPIVAFRYIPEG